MQKNKQQGSIPVGCVPSAFLIPAGGGVCPTRLQADLLPHGCRFLPPGCRPPGHVTCDACWEANPCPPWMLVMWPVMHAGKPPPPLPTPLDRMTDMCKTISLLQSLVKSLRGSVYGEVQIYKFEHVWGFL